MGKLTKWIFAVLLLALPNCNGPDPIPPTAPTGPLRVLLVQGPARMDVGTTSPFTAKWTDESGLPTVAADGAQWTVSASNILSVSSSGFGAALKAGTATITATATINGDTQTARLTVLVTPKYNGLRILNFPTSMNVGANVTVTAEALVDLGDGEVRIPIDQFQSLVPGTAPVAWEALTKTTLSISPFVTGGSATVNALAPGAGSIQAAFAGASATATTTVVAEGQPTVFFASGLNGPYSFGLTRGNSDCGLGLFGTVSGTFSVNGVPNDGQGGSAVLDYGAAKHQWDHLRVTAADARLTFDSEAAPSGVPGFQIIIHGEIVLPGKTGSMGFYWTPNGMTAASACATFTGPISGK